MRKVCSHEGCQRPVHAQGFCNSHYMTRRKSGQLGKIFESDPQVRFWSQVDKTGGCWIWTGSVTGGYGQFMHNWHAYRAHRFGYEVQVGPIPAGLHLDHLCRNKLCVRAEHLEPVTPRENVLRGTSQVAQNAAKTECGQGHRFTAENTYMHRGRRHCRTCSAATQRRYRERLASRSQSPQR